MFSLDAKTSRVRDPATDSLRVHPEFSVPVPTRKRPLRAAFPRRFESATMQRHSPKPDADTNQKPDSYDEAHYRAVFLDAPYYSTGRNWRDYAPAYRYGHAARDEHPNERFEQVEPQLAREWRRRKADSRLQWAEARGAVREAWRHHDEVARCGH